MTRKDTILIAVVINAGLLAILFTTAIIYDNEKQYDPIELATGIEEANPAVSDPAPALIASAPSTGDEVDNVLKYYRAPPNSPIVVEAKPVDHPVPSFSPVKETKAPEQKDELAAEKRPDTVEVTVKKGDVLEKIARAHHSTVNAIKKANNLKNENLSIGQVLTVPIKKNAVAKVEKEPAAKSEEKPKSGGDGAVYHIVKSGDNPWKIAKEYQVNYDDILRLNDLDEEKARNLKIGDRIKVK